MSSETQRKHADYMREYTRANADKINAQRRARRTAEYLERERLWRKKNRTKVLAYKKTDREKRPTDYKKWKQAWAKRHAAKLKARSKLLYQRDKAAMAKRVKLARLKNPESFAVRMKRWQQAHPERVRETKAASQSRRRARHAQTENEPIDFRDIYERDKHRCGLCHRLVAWQNFSLDHVVPLSRGGAHIKSNVQTAHRTCNSRKGNRGAVQQNLRLS